MGDGTNKDKNYPVLIGSNFSYIDANYFQSFGIKNDGTLWAWGANSWYQLGYPYDPEREQSIVNIGTEYSMVSAGATHGLGLKIDGTVWTWGNNEYGQLGINSWAEEEDHPVQIMPK